MYVCTVTQISKFSLSKNKFSDDHVLVISNLISHVIVLLFLESLWHNGRSEDGAAKASGRDSQEQLQVRNREKHFLTKLERRRS